MCPLELDERRSPAPIPPAARTAGPGLARRQRGAADRISAGQILFISLLALLLRLIWLHFRTGVIDTEGAEYARIAENFVGGRGYVGIATPGTQLLFPPLFPLLIAAFSALTRDFGTAARLVSIVFGALLVVPVYFIAWTTYGRKVASVAALLVAVHPLLINLSATGYSESLYLTLIFTGVYGTLQSLKFRRVRDGTMAGAAFGLAYLTRPEAFMFPFMAVALIALSCRTGAAGVLRRAGALLGTFAVLAAPYAIFLSLATGQLRFEGKSAINYVLGNAIVAGRSVDEGAYAVDRDLKEEGAYMRSNLSAIESASPTVRDVVPYALFAAKRNLPRLVHVLLSKTAFGSPLLLWLVILGMFTKSWKRDRILAQLALLMVPVSMVLGLLSVVAWVALRYYFIFLPTLIIWASEGIVELSKWVLATLGAIRRGAVLRSLAARSVTPAAVAAIALISYRGIGDVPDLAMWGPQSRIVKRAGEWLGNLHARPKTIMDTATNVAFQARAAYVPFPWSDSETALRYIEAKGIDFIVVRTANASSGRPYLSDWVENGIPDRRAELVYSKKSPRMGDIIIYRWIRDDGESALARGSREEPGREPPIVTPAPARAGPARGPLRISPANRRYFVNDAGRPVYLTGLHTWASFQDAGRLEPARTFDFDRYLSVLETHNLNFTKLWVWEQADWASWMPYHYRILPVPYLRTGPGLALDGQPRFDLTRFDPTYFERLRSRTIQAGEKGIYVSLMLFNGFSVENKGLEWEEPWRGHPYHRDNNINGVDGDPNRRGGGRSVHRLEDPTIVALEEGYVARVIDAVNDLDNVLFEICNESDQASTQWQYSMIRFIKRYEAGKPKRHPVGMTVNWPGGLNSDVEASPADWISPNASGGYDENPPAAKTEKVILTDTDHIWGIGGDRAWVWKSFMRGLNPVFMDPYDNTWLYPPSPETNDARWEDVRLNMGYAAALAARVDLTSLVPRGDLASSGFCLARPAAPGAEFLVYLPTARPVVVDLTRTPGTMTLEWLDPSTGATVPGGAVEGGATRTLTTPFDHDAVLHIW
jgi:4-amino-4-deoxy-L-arabinose transferase-like glycosyltransferase